MAGPEMKFRNPSRSFASTALIPTYRHQQDMHPLFYRLLRVEAVKLEVVGRDSYAVNAIHEWHEIPKRRLGVLFV